MDPRKLKFIGRNGSAVCGIEGSQQFGRDETQHPALLIISKTVCHIINLIVDVSQLLFNLWIFVVSHSIWRVEQGGHTIYRFFCAQQWISVSQQRYHQIVPSVTPQLSITCANHLIMISPDDPDRSRVLTQLFPHTQIDELGDGPGDQPRQAGGILGMASGKRSSNVASNTSPPMSG